MKKTITFLAVLFHFVASAQTYNRMLRDSNVWYVSGEMIFMGVSYQYKSAINGIGEPCFGMYKAVKDSVFNNKTYKIFTGVSPLKCDFYSTDHFQPVLIREDSVLKKIYVIPKDSTKERVAIDFSMSTGDSIYLIYPATNQKLISGYYRLDSIASKTELIGNRKHFYLSNKAAPIDPITSKRYFQEWVESIGALHFPINFMRQGTGLFGVRTNTLMQATCFKQQFGFYVTCKYSNNVQYYSDQCSYQYIVSHPSMSNVILSACNYYVSIIISGLNELESSSLTVFPNPAKNILRLEFGENIEDVTLQVKNSVGQLVLKHQFETGAQTDVDVSGLTPGVYLLCLTKNGKTQNIRFVKD